MDRKVQKNKRREPNNAASNEFKKTKKSLQESTPIHGNPTQMQNDIVEINKIARQDDHVLRSHLCSQPRPCDSERGTERNRNGENIEERVENQGTERQQAFKDEQKSRQKTLGAIEEEIPEISQKKLDPPHISMNNPSFSPQPSDQRHQNEDQQQDIDEIQEQINEIVKLLCEDKILDLYDSSLLQKPLAKKLFVEGIKAEELTPCCLQSGFQEIWSEDKSLIFYPSYITCEIFNQILKKKNTNFYLACCHGVGKSFSLALFAYLFRLKANTRIFYIHNSDSFFSNPIDCFVKVLWMAFQNEISDLEETSETLRTLIRKDLTLKQSSPFGSFLTRLKNKLEESRAEVFVIFDQADEIHRDKPPPAEANTTNRKYLFWTIFNLMRNWSVPKKTTVLMYSNYHEMTTDKPEQGFPLYTIKMRQPPSEVIDKYIRHRLGKYLESEKDLEKYEKVKAMVQNHFACIHEFAEHFKKDLSLDENIQEFSIAKISTLRIQSEIFLRAYDSNAELDLANVRKKRAVQILYDLLNGITYSLDLPEIHYDARFFFRRSGSFQALHPFITSVYREIFARQRLDYAIKQFAYNPLVLRFLLENAILVSCRRYISPLIELELISMSDFRKPRGKLCLKKCSTNDDFFSKSFELKQMGFSNSIISLYDAYIFEKDKIKALKIRKTFDKKRVDNLIANMWKVRKPCGNEKDAAWKILGENLKKSKKSFETILISIGQNPKKDKAFASLRKRQNKNEAKKFFYADARRLLLSLNLSDQAMKIIRDDELKSNLRMWKYGQQKIFQKF